MKQQNIINIPKEELVGMVEKRLNKSFPNATIKLSSYGLKIIDEAK